MDKEKIIKEILEKEWELFTNLKNTGGRANCQDNKEEFYNTRLSQWENLSRDINYSYLRDLNETIKQGRNLLFEKYAYMMEYTHKDEYDKIKDYLPAVDERNEKVIEKIENIVMEWERQFYNKYPKFCKNVRSMEEIKENDIAPAKVYLIGEHKSYSYTTNLLYLQYIKSLDYNLVEKIYQTLVAKKGLPNLDELEGSL
ncbi:DUF4125 family protein [Oceanivirga salmonicida]|uniref:DUF4125 family protein n=1 Tax=Oceanivirga salmonicida TaxID=1769291 RepID=UPI0012E2284C|nr:DUF4125 family protein [Oceanivirga salmonicida]